MQRKMHGRVHLNRLLVGSLETEPDVKLLKKEEFVKGMVKNLTMLDIIGLAVLTMFQPVLFHAQQTDEDNPQGRLTDRKNDLNINPLL